LVAACAAPEGTADGLADRALHAEERGRWLEAGETWQRLLAERGGRDPRAARGLARALERQGDPAGACRILAGARARGVVDTALAQDLARLLVDQGRGAEAIEVLTEACAADPDASAARKHLGELLLARGDPAALPPLRELVRLTPDDGAAQRLLALAEGRAGYTDAALAAWGVAFERGAASVDDALVAGALALSAGGAALSPAVRWLERAAARAPGRAEVHALYGRLRLAVGDLAGAAADLQRALEIDPADLDTLMRLAELRAERGEWERLGRLTTHARAITSDPELLGRLEALLARRGD